MSVVVVSGPSVSISVDLDSQMRGAATPSPNLLEPVVRPLVDLLGKARMTATWFAAEPAISPSVHQVLDSDCSHEAAIVLAGDWSGHEQGRIRFATELLRRKRAAEQSGILVATIAAPNGVTPENHEFLVRHGIMVIRSGEVTTRRGKGRTASRGITSLRYGLWQIGDVVKLSAGGWFGGHFSAGRICRAIDGAIADRTVLHLVIDVPRLATERRPALNGFAKVLRHITQCQSAGLRAGSVTEMISRLTAPKAVRSAHSVLRAA
jgi:hypothetical protein